MSQILPHAISSGDPTGIGPEIVAKCFAEAEPPQAFVIGDPARLQRAAALTGADVRIVPLAQPQDFRYVPGTMPVLACGAPVDGLPFGILDARAGRAAYDYVQKGIDFTLAGAVRGLVTAPINKEAMSLAGLKYPGHTEILAERSGVEHFAMMLANEEIRVVLATIHVSVRQACDLITYARELDTIRLAHRAARDLGLPAARVAVAGLNPHAGEGGLFGREDVDIIAPAIAAARAEGIDASGPWPGDTVFFRARRGEFDVVVAQYHDQGLIPVKYMGIADGVNVTIGLPFVRTSPDHGTAFDIAGKGVADHRSMLVALRYADQLSAARAEREAR
ncbi:4-hydroxythreonine-4-phosphate dehydrogenase PdxA [Methylovirgula sp. 4M-Z18]|uniref:4-hydroxythreonine-4-phosphate dehydrogenase PdxA n=1 Tax=Methylovirgula sp. 4M-Z18 TaxID=2293567 RepID=UPI000E2F3ECE|nr:4-hydroxythreonine-4-phosphate dehydrogenase PdxA [Methylovirgula sp. 4M-Z18]RFB81597.1 4-hydroxythreonine-4-phosphate dehydrogenase PdxA [Methylovirgula sp. 4M-Z18]